MHFWRKREQTLPAARRPSPELLLNWSMGQIGLFPDHGDPVCVATYLLDQGANLEGTSKLWPLGQAVFMNRPRLVELLVRRGAKLSRPGRESLLESAKLIVVSDECFRLLNQAGAPPEVPTKPQRPKPIRTIELRPAAEKLKAGIEKAIRSFVRRHRREIITAIALASIPHEGYVMISFDTGNFEGSPWDCSHDCFAWIKFPDWTKAHEADTFRLVDLDGCTLEKSHDALLPRFKKMIVTVLKQLEQEKGFKALNTAKGCRIGIEMTSSGAAIYWRLRQ